MCECVLMINAKLLHFHVTFTLNGDGQGKKCFSQDVRHSKLIKTKTTLFSIEVSSWKCWKRKTNCADVTNFSTESGDSSENVIFACYIVAKCFFFVFFLALSHCVRWHLNKYMNRATFLVGDNVCLIPLWSEFYNKSIDLFVSSISWCTLFG